MATTPGGETAWKDILAELEPLSPEQQAALEQINISFNAAILQAEQQYRENMQNIMKDRAVSLQRFIEDTKRDRQ